MRCPQRILRKAEGRHQHLTRSLAYPLFDRRGACGGHVTAQPINHLILENDMHPMLFEGTPKTAEKLSPCTKCEKLTSPILGCYMAGKLVCHGCTQKALKAPKRHA